MANRFILRFNFSLLFIMRPSGLMMKNRQKNKRGIMLLLLLSFCYFLSSTSITSPPSTLFISTISYFSAIFSKYSIPWRVFNTLFVITLPFFSCFKFFSTNFYSFLSVYFAIMIQYISHRFNISLVFHCTSATFYNFLYLFA